MTPDHANLALLLKTGVNKTTTFHFARFLYVGVPPLTTLHKGTSAHRDSQVYRWHQCIAATQEYSDTTKYGYISDLIQFVRFCDSQGLIPESQTAVTYWERHLVEGVRLGNLRVNTARKLLSCTRCLLQLLGHPTKQWFSPYHLFRAEVNPTQGYTDAELKQLVRLISAFFKQVSQQIIQSPERHLGAATNKQTAIFQYQGHEHHVASPVTKCFSAAFYLLAYYTWGNTTVLLNMVKPADKTYADGTWFEQSVLKPRANKYVSISIGDNGTFHVPKYALTFFEQLLKVSYLASATPHLLWQTKARQVAPLEPAHLQTFATWLQTTFSLQDSDGSPLRPTARKFRASGSYRYLAKTGSQAETSLLLGNTPQVVSRHYSSGNQADNNNQLLAVAYTLEGVAKCTDIQAAKAYAKQALAVDILPYEAFLAKYGHTHGQKTVLGTGCKNVFDQHAEKYRRRHDFSPGDFAVDHLACADIHHCFSCPNQVIIDSVEDMWCLLSYQQTILDSRLNHLTPQHFDKNYAGLMDAINRILFSIHPKTRRLAEKKLKQEGRHPLWPEQMNVAF